MSPEAADERIILSDAAIAVFEREGTQSGPITDIQERLRIEIKVLGSLAFDYPEKATKIAILINRYKAHGSKLAALLN